MDKENTFLLDNGVLLSCLRHWHHKIQRQIIVARKKNILGDITETQKDKNCISKLISGYSYKVKDNHANTHRPEEAM